MRTTTTISAVAALAALIAGCGSNEIDTGKAESYVRKALNPRPTTVKCPSGVSIQKGKTFTCQVGYGDGDKGSVTVHMVDSSGKVSLSSGDLHVTTIGVGAAETVVRNLATRTTNVPITSLSCPGPTPASQGGTIVCHVSFADGSKGTITEHIVGQNGGLQVTRGDVRGT